MHADTVQNAISVCKENFCLGIALAAHYSARDISERNGFFGNGAGPSWRVSCTLARPRTHRPRMRPHAALSRALRWRSRAPLTCKHLLAYNSHAVISINLKEKSRWTSCIESESKLP